MTVQELNTLFGQNLKAFRERKGWTQVKLAMELGTCETVISWYETGKMFASARMLISISSLLGIEIWQLYVTDSTAKKEALTKEMTIQGIREQVGKNIRYYRRKKELKQNEIAEKLGVNHSTVSNHETNRHFPTLEELVKYANILDVEVWQLFSNKELIYDK